MKFDVVNLGCKVNRVEADSISLQLMALGAAQATHDADVVVVNSCTVTAEADRKTRKEVNRALQAHPRARVLVTGCAAAIDPQAFEALGERVQCVGKDEVVKACQEAAGCVQAKAEETLLRTGAGFPTRVGIKVQDGCDNACTFCIVHVARGPARSMPLEQVVRQAAAYEQAGVREAVLTGIDLGAYRFDGVGLAGLVRAIRAAAPRMRLRISSIEPVTIDEAFVEVLAGEQGMVCRHLHVPLQSGSDEVLAQMARRYTAQGYLDLIERVKKAVPGVSVSTDVIVGFPGETDAQFNETLQLLRHVGFEKAHVFRYSARAGTPAASRPDQVAPLTKAERAQQLAQVCEDMRQAKAQARVGSIEQVLVESRDRGMTESYYPVLLQGRFERGQLVKCRLASFGKDGAFRL